MKYIIGVGASAGGLEALEHFFKNMPLRQDVAFVVVQHLSPDYKSLMVELLSKHTAMPVHRVENATPIELGCIYLIPPRKTMTIEGDSLYLRDYEPTEKLHLPIDIFFHSLAEEKGPLAVGVILSGTGSDGTNGIRAIKEAGGMVMVQDEFSAQFNGMPKSAIYTGLVDFVLPPEEMGRKLSDYIDNHKTTSEITGDDHANTDQESLQRIYTHIKRKWELDLSLYKQNTILRRLERRMSIHHINTLRDYELLLRKSREETSTLCNELLIGVTRFFRDADAFAFLQHKIIPTIFEDKSQEKEIRIWVSACSTGEEAYSIAMLFRNYIKTSRKNIAVKIFATDFDRNAVEFAASGLYPCSIAADIPAEFLQQYFVPCGEYYQIAKEIREMLIFATHNITNDPPFNKIDLVTCRNLLIYFQPFIQKRVISFFDYALNPGGYLFLGPSETIGDENRSFDLLESRWKIYRHKTQTRVASPGIEGLFTNKAAAGRHLMHDRYPAPNGKPLDSVYRLLLQTYMQPAVVVDESYTVLLTCGGASQFLTVPEGIPTFRLTDMLAKEAVTPVMIALRKAFKQDVRSVYQYHWQKNDGMSQPINLTVELMPEITAGAKYCLVKFITSEPSPAEDVQPIFDLNADTTDRIQELESELQYTKENLQAVVEELETANEELQATNEELLSSNEELQSTNEELQSVNEELITLNSEYQMKITELTDLNNDMDNLMSSTNIGTLFLDANLLIRKFTPAVTQIINILEQDIGRPILHISHKLDNSDLIGESLRVLESRSPLKKEVVSQDGQIFLQTIFPYITRDNYMKGVVITFVNITELKLVRQQVSILESERNNR